MKILKYLGYVWSLPNVLVGLLLSAGYWPKGARWVEGCLELKAHNTMIGAPAGQTWGWVIWYNERTWEMDTVYKRSIRHHEQVHVRQGAIGGVFFMLAYAACFLYYWARGGFKDWYAAYMDIPFEVTAYVEQSKYLSRNRRTP